MFEERCETDGYKWNGGQAGMEEEKFEWFEGDAEAEIEEFVPAPPRPSSISYAIDAVGGIFYSIFVLALAVRLGTYVFNLTPSVLGVDMNVVFLTVMVVSLLFIVLAVAREAMTFMVLTLGVVENSEVYAKLQKLAMVSVWFACSIYWVKYVKAAYGYDFDLAHRVFVAGVITSVAYSIATVAIAYFESFFLRRTLKSKLGDVQKSERIVCAMKNYRYDISDPTSVATPECSCKDLFCFRTSAVAGNRASRAREDEEGFHLFTGGLQINPPELHGVVDARKLARDVFNKASRGAETLSFDDFSMIFPSTQDALNAFAFFDSNNDRVVSKKEFRDTIIYFYMERVNLEKSIKRTEDFIGVVANALNGVVFVVLCFTYLIIFGIPLKELLALALSGAIAFNFIASGIIADVYYNFMMLVTHQFDIGDDVIVDGVDYKVHEFGLANTALIGENGGKVKLLNSELWKKNLVNMTRAPEKIIVFNFDLDPSIKVDDFARFKSRIHEFVRAKPFDYDDAFSVQAVTENFSSIDVLSCAMILKCKSYKNKSKKFLLRVEMTTFLRSLIAEMGVGAK